MARIELPASLAEIRNPSSIQEQIAALKQLKNEIIGHDQRKELVIRHGIVTALVRNLQTSVKASGKRWSREVNGNGVALGKGHAWTHEDELRLQTTTIITSLAHGGPSIVTPLVAGGVIEPLLSALSPTSVPARLVVETLRAIYVIADAFTADLEPESSHMAETLESQLFSKPTIDSFAEILSQRGCSAAINNQFVLTTRIIGCSVRSKKSRETLVKVGILDILASKLAAYITMQIPHSPALLPPPPPRASLPHLLDSITHIIRGSSYRSMRLIYNKDIYRLFPTLSPVPISFDQSASFTDSSSMTSSGHQTISYLLPKLQAMQNRPEHNFTRAAFPVLSSLVPPGDLARLSQDTQLMSAPRTIGPDEIGAPLMAWLVHFARTTTEFERLAAIWLLANLTPAINKVSLEVHTDPSHLRNRERSLALLVIPMIVKMIDDATPRPTSTQDMERSDQSYVKLVRERAPRALAKLITDSSALQKAAVDAGAVKIVSQLLKKTFEPVTISRKSMWSPASRGTQTTDSLLEATSSSPAPVFMSSEAINAFMARSSALRAITAIAQKEDTVRKLIIEASIVQYIFDSLKPLPDSPINALFPPNETSTDLEGNPTQVLVAACTAVTALARSVSILRTSLIDLKIAKPIFDLLKHPNLQVKQASTDTMINLLLPFSPVRTELIELGVLDVLCDHAHSAEPELRISALWALKHLVNQADNKLKCQCIEALGSGWLIQTLTTEPRELGNSHKAHMATANAAGEQVDLLNAEESSLNYESELDASSDEDEDMGDSLNYLRASQANVTVPTRRALRLRLRIIKESEESPALQARKDDVRTQVQALDFIRNLIGEPGPGQHEMIEYILVCLGAARLFDILTGKLKPRSTANSNVSSSSTPTAPTPRGPAGKQPKLSTPSSSSTFATSFPQPKASYPANPSNPPSPFHNQPVELITSTLFILIHIANGRPTHRHHLISQSPLLTALIPIFNHPDRRVRVACCWLVHNLTWQEDAADHGGARQRAAMLRDRGIEECIKPLLRDEDIDTRERAKMCVDQFRRLLSEEGNGGVPGGGAVGGVPGLEVGGRGIWQR